MKIRNLIWDEWNEEHILKHGVSKEEVEEVCYARHFAIKSGDGKREVWGQTEDGRFILVILAARGYDDYYPISTRDMEDREKSQYKKWTRR